MTHHVITKSLMILSTTILNLIRVSLMILNTTILRITTLSLTELII